MDFETTPVATRRPAAKRPRRMEDALEAPDSYVPVALAPDAPPLPPPKRRWHLALSALVAILGSVGLIGVYVMLRDLGASTGAVADAVNEGRAASLNGMAHAAAAVATLSERPAFDRAAAVERLERHAADALSVCGTPLRGDRYVDVTASFEPTGQLALMTLKGSAMDTERGRCFAVRLSDGVFVDAYDGETESVHARLRVR